MKVDFENVKRPFKKIPAHIRDKLLWWAIQVETVGLYEVRRSPGWGDEALKGHRFGQRSIRLSRAYRAIYRIDKKSKRIIILEVHKHRY